MTKKMSPAEFLKEYGERQTRFQSYYKYSFVYRSTETIPVLVLGVGGDRDDIYRSSLKAEMTVLELLREVGREYLYVTIRGEQVEFEGEWFPEMPQ